MEATTALSLAGTTLAAYFAIMNPIASTPIFISLTEGDDAATKRSVAVRSLAVAFGIVVVVSLAGNLIFKLFGISLATLRITGGVVLFIIGYQMLQGAPAHAHKPSDADVAESRDAKLSVAVSPLGVPMLADPGTIATAMNFAAGGWDIASYFGDRAHYNGDWLLRAAGAQAGIYGNESVEAAYPLTRKDAAGDPLDGSKHNYTLTFPAGQFPPVNAFWSITLYDGKTQFLIKNPINRYLINSPMLPNMKKGSDGSLTIYIQKDSPGQEKESNWLPAPDGPIYLAMRLYWPKTEAPSILPIGKGTWKPPGVAQAKSRGFQTLIPTMRVSHKL